jgi:HK97 family phage major capsid protein/HK97 family phage prohead protease
MEIQYRTAETAGRGLDFVLSDGSRDRHGTRINPAGWDLSNFKRNPIALFGHSSGFPIGTWENVRIVGGKLMGRLKLAAKGTSARIDELISLVEQGVLRAVSVGFSPIEEGVPGKSNFEYERQELHEVSLVSVGSNVNALAMARALNVSPETLSLAFGEHAEERRGDLPTGEHANTPTAGRTLAPSATRPRHRTSPMTTLSQRIQDAQADLVAKRDRAVELNNADALDLDAIEALNEQIETAERTVAALKVSEQRIGITAQANGSGVTAPAVNRKPLGFPQREVNGFDLLVRAMTANGISHFDRKPIERVLDERYPGHEATHNLVTRADQTIGTTTVSGWASELLQTVNSGFLQALTGMSVYPRLRDRGVGLSFDGTGTIKLPRRTAGGAGGGFVAEGSPIRVGRITTAAAEITPKKMGVIVPFSRELARRSTPAIEAIVRQAILEDTAAILDAALLDATAVSTARPAGLLNGVSAVGVGYGGGDHTAVKEDFKALLAPFIAANAADNITVIMNPAQALSIAMMDGPDNNAGWFSGISSRVNIVESTYATNGRLIAIRNSDFYTAVGDAPEFDINETATVHMEDTTPLEIVSGTGPTTADPVRSFFQTATVGVRMLLDVSWVMGRPSMVNWVDGTSY